MSTPRKIVRAAVLLVAASLSAEAMADQSAKHNEKVRQLCGIRWHTSLEHAQKDAAKDKPLMVLRVLGELDGFM